MYLHKICQRKMKVTFQFDGKKIIKLSLLNFTRRFCGRLHHVVVQFNKIISLDKKICYDMADVLCDIDSQLSFNL